MRNIRTLLAASLLVLLTTLAPTSAFAAAPDGDPDMQDRVDQVLSVYGGEQTDWNEVTWNDGEVVLTLAPESTASEATRATAGNARRSAISVAAASTDDCDAGKYCAYSLIGYKGNKLTYATCPATYTSFTALGSVRSIKNDRSSGTVRAYNGGTLKATLSAGSGISNVSQVTKITCS